MASDDEAQWPAEREFSTLEGWLLAIWQELLGQDVVASDNFFEAGGDSVLAMETAALIQDAGYSRLPTSAVFRWPTVAQLASELVSYAS